MRADLLCTGPDCSLWYYSALHCNNALAGHQSVTEALPVQFCSLTLFLLLHFSYPLPLLLFIIQHLQHDHLVIRGELLPDDDAPAGGVHPHHAHHPLLVLPLKQQGDPDQEDLLEDGDDTLCMCM